jgi:hypothetical protein
MFLVDDSYINNKIYNGSRDKLGITINGVDYLVKFPHRGYDNVLSEAVTSRFLKYLGFTVHNVALAKYTGNVLSKHTGSIVCCCEDFTKQYGGLESLMELSSSIDTNTENHAYFLRDVLYEFNEVHKLDYDSTFKAFCKLIIADAITGNTDRHVGNWGFCNNGKTRTFAPIYDNDACLFPRADKNVQITEDWMKERVFVFPNSKIMAGDKRERAAYHDLVYSKWFDSTVRAQAQNLDVVSAMRQTCIDFNISGAVRQFFVTVVYYRYTCIVQNKPFEWGGCLY